MATSSSNTPSGSGSSTKLKASFSTISEPTCLHDIIVDYIITNAYHGTAQSLLQYQNRNKESTSHGESSSNVTNGNGGSSSNGTRDRDGDGDVNMNENGGTSSRNGMDELSGKNTPTGSRTTAYRGRLLDEGIIQSIERRRAIVNYILNGAIMRALDALNTHYPSVLADPPSQTSNGHSNGHILGDSSGSYSNGHNHGSSLSHTPPPWSNSGSTSNLFSKSTTISPPSTSLSYISPSGFSSSNPDDHGLPVLPNSTLPQHVRLNLQIQQFIESFRQLAPSSPSSPSSSISSLTSSHQLGLPTTTHTNNGSVTLTHALTAAQGLHTEAKKLPAEDRAVYLQEIKDVGALFAYSEPETSILKGFLEQGRRIALAEQVNRAILRSENYPTHSSLETFARRTTATYSIMHSKGIDSNPTWTAADGEGKQRLAMKKGFKLHDFVSEPWH